MDERRFPYYVAVFVFVAWAVLTGIDAHSKSFEAPPEINYAFGIAVAWALGGPMIKQVLPFRTDPPPPPPVPRRGTHLCPICTDGPFTADELADHLHATHPISKGRYDDT